MPPSPSSRKPNPGQPTSSFFSTRTLFRPTYRHRKLKIAFLPLDGDTEASPTRQRASPYPQRRPGEKGADHSYPAGHVNLEDKDRSPSRIGALSRWMRANRLRPQLDMPSPPAAVYLGVDSYLQRRQSESDTGRRAKLGGSSGSSGPFPTTPAVDPVEAAMEAYMTFGPEPPMSTAGLLERRPQEPPMRHGVPGRPDSRGCPRSAETNMNTSALGALGFLPHSPESVSQTSHDFHSLSLSTPKTPAASGTQGGSGGHDRTEALPNSSSSPSTMRSICIDTFVPSESTSRMGRVSPSRTALARSTDSNCTPDLLDSSVQLARRIRIGPSSAQILSPEQDMILTPPSVAHTPTPGVVRTNDTPSSSRGRQPLEALRRMSDTAVTSPKGKRASTRNNSLTPQDLRSPHARRRLQVSPTSPARPFGAGAASPRPIPSRQMSWREAERRGSLPTSLAAPFASPPPPSGHSPQIPVPAIPSIFRTTPLPSPTEEAGPSASHPFLSTGYQFPAPSSHIWLSQVPPGTPQGALTHDSARLGSAKGPQGALQMNRGRIPVSPAHSLLDDYYMDFLDAPSDSDSDRDISGSPMIKAKKCGRHEEAEDDPSANQSQIAAGALKNHTLLKAFQEKYELGDELGYGGFGFVCAARQRLGDGQLSPEVAVKFVYKDKMAPETAEYYDGWPGEPYILSHCDHPNIVRFFDFYEDDRFFYYVTELHGDPWQPGHTLDEVLRPSLLEATRSLDGPPGLVASPASSLSDIPSEVEHTPSKVRPSMGRRASHDLFECVENHRFTEEQARHVFLQIVSAVEYMHNKGFYHRDLKDENVVVDRDLKVKLIDFGSAVAEDVDIEQQYYDQFRGTMSYAAPEIINGSSYRAGQADIWALGIILAILLTGASPFVSQEDARMGYIRLKTRVEGDARHLLGWCLSANAELRPTIAQVVKHPWCQEPGLAL